MIKQPRWRVFKNRYFQILFITAVFLLLILTPKISNAKESYNMGPIPFMDFHTETIGQVSSDTAEIIWFTGNKATSQIVYGTLPVADNQLQNNQKYGYQKATEVDINGVTYHKMILDNLDSNTTYYLRVVSLPDVEQWPGAAAVFSGELTFTTNKQSEEINDGTGGPEENDNVIVKPPYVPKTSEKGSSGVVLGEDIDGQEIADSSTDLGQEELFEEEISLPAEQDEKDTKKTDSPRTMSAWFKELFWWIILAIVVGIIVYSLPERKDKANK
ncbi:fibronectin type III domain-containing protein [Patescibacteria group bacterium]|nr:fibronectin type III domain-containing protein [Patescibacteria group bacterium]